MKVKVTKIMTNTLDKYAKNHGVKYRFVYHTATLDYYRTAVNLDVFGAYDNGDFDENNGVFKYIAVIYPPEWYAVNQYITTADLRRLFDKSDTVDSFCERVIEAYAI